MNDQQQIIKIRQLISPLLDSLQVELIDLELKGAIGNQFLKIFVDVEGGIDLSLCVNLSRQISDILDIHDTIPGKYRLEVSSPGTDRPLKTINDFRRNIGRRIKINYLTGNSLEGLIRKVSDSSFLIEEDEGKDVEVALSTIKFAQLVLQW